ncbi:unnamed protein product [Paramecium sonneborni]|uniref:Uncharacterized protein n=1 Tax=Paramecium sonneborni TaxID=65129 RepID=A0A8S1NHB3_9CILI|nr:unnamed protein product [Paramecium sonneborni]
MLNSSLYQSPQTKNLKSVIAPQSSITDRNVSPSRAKIAQLSEKLSGLQIDEDKTLKKETYESKLKLFDEKFQKAYQNDINRLKIVQDQLSKMEEGLTNEKIIRDSRDDNFKQRDLKGLEQSIVKELQKDKTLRRESELKVARLIDEKSYQFRLELAKQKKMREETEEQYSNEIGERVLNLAEEVQNERREREAACQELIRRFGESVFQIQETLTKEKRQRQESQSQMYRMIDEMNNILNLQLTEEKSQREATEETMLRLLDETCNRVENSLRR